MKASSFLRPVDEREIVADDARRSGRRATPLGALAVEQRDLLGVFAQPRQREAEVGFHALALEIEPDQRAPDQMGDPRSGRRIDQRDPEQEAGDVRSSVPGMVKFADRPHSTTANDTSEDSVEISRIE